MEHLIGGLALQFYPAAAAAAPGLSRATRSARQFRAGLSRVFSAVGFVSSSATSLVADREQLQRQLADTRAHVAQLESDLDAALRPPPPTNSAERAVRRVIRTASKVRSHGITGLIQSTVEDLQT